MSLIGAPRSASQAERTIIYCAHAIVQSVRGIVRSGRVPDRWLKVGVTRRASGRLLHARNRSVRAGDRSEGSCARLARRCDRQGSASVPAAAVLAGRQERSSVLPALSFRGLSIGASPNATSQRAVRRRAVFLVALSLSALSFRCLACAAPAGAINARPVLEYPLPSLSLPEPFFPAPLPSLSLLGPFLPAPLPRGCAVLASAFPLSLLALLLVATSLPLLSLPAFFRPLY